MEHSNDINIAQRRRAAIRHCERAINRHCSPRLNEAVEPVVLAGYYGTLIEQWAALAQRDEDGELDFRGMVARGYRSALAADVLELQRLAALPDPMVAIGSGVTEAIFSELRVPAN